MNLLPFKSRATGRRLPMVGVARVVFPAGYSPYYFWQYGAKEYMTARQCSSQKRRSRQVESWADDWLCAEASATTVWSAPIAASAAWMTQVGYWG